MEVPWTEWDAYTNILNDKDRRLKHPLCDHKKGELCAWCCPCNACTHIRIGYALAVYAEPRYLAWEAGWSAKTAKEEAARAAARAATAAAAAERWSRECVCGQAGVSLLRRQGRGLLPALGQVVADQGAFCRAPVDAGLMGCGPAW